MTDPTGSATPPADGDEAVDGEALTGDTADVDHDADSPATAEGADDEPATHEGSGDGGGSDDVPVAEGLRIAVLSTDPEVLAAGVRDLPRHMAQEIARHVGVPAPVLVRDPAPARILRRTENPALFTALAESIAGDCLEATIEVLGDRADDPTLDELRAAVDVVAERFPHGTVAMMLAATSTGGAPAARACDRILADDARFALPTEIPDEVLVPPAADDTGGAGGGAADGSTGPSPEQLEARKQRKAQKAEKQARERERQRKAAEAARASRKRRKG